MSKVIVLGTTLEGLLAGHAASIAGADVYFVTEGDETKGPPGGLDFLAAPIPMTTARAVPLSVDRKGEGAFFYQKLSGSGSGKPIELPVSEMDGRPVWDPKETYDQLHSIYSPFFHEPGPDGISPEFVSALAGDAKIISAVQMPSICTAVDDHTFSWAGLVRMPAVRNPDGHLITMSGDLDDAWAIEGSTFFGSYRVYSATNYPPVSSDKVTRDYLPLKTNCKCWPDIIKVSAGALWDSNYPTHHAFYRTFEVLDL